MPNINGGSEPDSFCKWFLTIILCILFIIIVIIIKSSWDVLSTAS